MSHKAVFFDRDGTMIELVHYLNKPEQVQLIEGTGPAIKKLRSAGYKVIAVTNQSAIGRGYSTIEGLEEVHAVMMSQLAEHDTTIDGIYFCPVTSANQDRSAQEHPSRKPAPGMLIRGADEHDIDITQSWMVGDMNSDIYAGLNAGCKGNILVRTGYGKEIEAKNDPKITTVVDDLPASVELIMQQDGLSN